MEGMERGRVVRQNREGKTMERECVECVSVKRERKRRYAHLEEKE